MEAGLTSVHWLIRSPIEIRIIQKLRTRNELPLRVYLIVPVGYLDHLTDLGLCTGFGDDKVRIGSIKIVVDGSLGARTAALHEPYNDEPATRGMTLYSPEELKAMVKKAHEADFQLAIHAIGDRALDMVLTALETVLKEMPRENHRHRIEHASVLSEELVRRMKELEVIASIQPHFIVSDFWAADRVGSTRSRWVYPFQTLIRKGIPTVAGSDGPVEPIDPLLGIHAAVVREGLHEERITVEDALRFYTVNAAYASFEENVKGSIEAGKLADLVVLSKDPRAIPPDEIRDVGVEMTIVGGKVVYERSTED